MVLKKTWDASPHREIAIHSNSKNNLAIRFPRHQGQELPTNTKILIAPTQRALVVHRGHLTDLIPPGEHEVAVTNFPGLQNLCNWSESQTSPLDSDLFFFSISESPSQKWASNSAMEVKDRRFQSVLVKARGALTYQISNPKFFFARVSGFRDKFTTSDLESYITKLTRQTIATFLQSSDIGMVELCLHQDKLKTAIASNLLTELASIGLKLCKFEVQQIVLPNSIKPLVEDSITNLSAEVEGHHGRSSYGNSKTYIKFVDDEVLLRQNDIFDSTHGEPRTRAASRKSKLQKA